MRQIISRMKQGLPEGSSRRLKTFLGWFLFGTVEDYATRMSNKYIGYTTSKPCGSKPENVHPCDVTRWYTCRNCELS